MIIVRYVWKYKHRKRLQSSFCNVRQPNIILLVVLVACSLFIIAFSWLSKQIEATKAICTYILHTSFVYIIIIERLESNSEWQTAIRGNEDGRNEEWRKKKYEETKRAAFENEIEIMMTFSMRSNQFKYWQLQIKLFSAVE